MASSERKREIVTIDPDLYMERMLHYNEKHSGWRIFKSIYWSMYLLLVGGFLLYYSSGSVAASTLAGISVILLAVMIIIYGFAESLHYKFMKRYG